jgi:hypothetical protein
MRLPEAQAFRRVFDNQMGAWLPIQRFTHLLRQQDMPFL